MAAKKTTKAAPKKTSGKKATATRSPKAKPAGKKTPAKKK